MKAAWKLYELNYHNMYHVYIQIHGEEQFVSGFFLAARSSGDEYVKWLFAISSSTHFLAVLALFSDFSTFLWF